MKGLKSLNDLFVPEAEENVGEPVIDGWDKCLSPVVCIFKGQEPTKPLDQVVIWNFLRTGPINWVPAECVVVQVSDNNNCQAKNGGNCDGCERYGSCAFTSEEPDGICNDCGCHLEPDGNCSNCAEEEFFNRDPKPVLVNTKTKCADCIHSELCWDEDPCIDCSNFYRPNRFESRD